MDRRSLYLVTDSYWPARGGVEETARSLAAHLCSQYHITVITHSAVTGLRRSSLCAQYLRLSSMAPYFDPAGCEVLPLVPSTTGRLVLLLLCLWNLPVARRTGAGSLFDKLYAVHRVVFRGQVRNLLESASIVHCFSTGYLARCVTEICLEEGIPLVQSPFIHFGKWGDSPAQINAYVSSDMVICPTNAFRSKLVSLCGQQALRTTVVPPVVSAPPTAPLAGLRPPVAQPFILFLGRREAHKGLAMLLVAFRGLEHLASLVIAGPGQSLNIRSSLAFDLGEVDDGVKHWLLSHCELLCVPSSDETFGLVYAEAMSHGKPIVALDVPPMREIVQHELTGLLVDSSDTDALRVALARMLMDDGLRRRMSKAARRRYEQLFSGDRIAAQISDVYRDLLAKSGKPHSDDVETKAYNTEGH